MRYCSVLFTLKINASFIDSQKIAKTLIMIIICLLFCSTSTQFFYHYPTLALGDRPGWHIWKRNMEIQINHALAR